MKDFWWSPILNKKLEENDWIETSGNHFLSTDF